MQAIHTEKLTLRPYLKQDFQAVHALFKDEDNARYMLMATGSDDEMTTMFENELANCGQKSVTEYAYAVEPYGGNEFAGVCIIVVDENGSEAELGWAIDKAYWGRGLGTHIAGMLIKHGFEELNLRRIFAVCDSENVGSYRVMEKNGMRREGHFVKSRRSRGVYRDELYYAILKEEWEGAQ